MPFIWHLYDLHDINDHALSFLDLSWSQLAHLGGPHQVKSALASDGFRRPKIASPLAPSVGSQTTTPARRTRWVALWRCVGLLSVLNWLDPNVIQHPQVIHHLGGIWTIPSHGRFMALGRPHYRTFVEMGWDDATNMIIWCGIWDTEKKICPPIAPILKGPESTDLSNVFLQNDPNIPKLMRSIHWDHPPRWKNMFETTNHLQHSWPERLGVDAGGSDSGDTAIPILYPKNCHSPKSARIDVGVHNKQYNQYTIIILNQWQMTSNDIKWHDEFQNAHLIAQRPNGRHSFPSFPTGITGITDQHPRSSQYHPGTRQHNAGCGVSTELALRISICLMTIRWPSPSSLQTTWGIWTLAAQQCFVSCSSKSTWPWLALLPKMVCKPHLGTRHENRAATLQCKSALELALKCASMRLGSTY